RKLLKQVNAIVFYTRGNELRGYSAALPLLVGLFGRTDAAVSGSRRERCHRIRRGVRSRPCDGRVTPSDHRRAKGTAASEGVARGAAGTIANSAEGRRTKENRRQGSDTVERSGSTGRPFDPWRSRIALTLDMQKRAEVGGGTPAGGSCGQAIRLWPNCFTRWITVCRRTRRRSKGAI